MGAFSDGVIAVIITIMVLELKSPREANLHALLALWPTFLSYGLSYMFVALVWVNHHHLLRYVERAEPRVIWSNFLFLFSVSLIPFFTAYIADSRLAPFTLAVYAMVCVGINLSFMLFQWTVSLQVEQDAAMAAKVKLASKRNWLAMAAYALAAPAAYLHVAVSVALVLGATAAYIAPELQKMRCRD
jgi:TMEM175 potassium channel family protein